MKCQKCEASLMFKSLLYLAQQKSFKHQITRVLTTACTWIDRIMLSHYIWLCCLQCPLFQTTVIECNGYQLCLCLVIVLGRASMTFSFHGMILSHLPGAGDKAYLWSMCGWTHIILYLTYHPCKSWLIVRWYVWHIGNTIQYMCEIIFILSSI